MRLSIVFCALVLAACSAPATESAERTGDNRQAIVGGRPSPAAQDATVLVNDRGRALCSGTLIAPNLVLTARHCVTELDEESDCGTVLSQTPPARLSVSVGASASPDAAVARGVKLYVPASNELCRADIALLSLDSDVPDITPAKVSFAAATQDEVGTAIGYGDNADERTQRADVKVLAVGPVKYAYRTQRGEMIAMDPLENEIVTTESTCFGDSGGPLLDGAGRVFAVASRGIDETCRDRPTFWTTLAGHEQLIREAASAVGHPIVDTPAGPSPSTKSPTMTGDGTTGDDGTPGDGAASKRTKPDGSLEDEDSVDSAGCATTPRGASSPVAALVGVALGLATLRRRSRRPSASPRPSSPRSSSLR